MSYSLDVNLLLYASDEASPHHGSAVEFLHRCTSEPDLLCLSWQTVMSYLRIATHPRIFSRPLTPEQALRNVEEITGLPQARLLSEETGFLELYREVTGSFPVRGNLVPDAHLATLLRQHGVPVLYSNDSDFRKFTFLELRNPLA